MNKNQIVFDFLSKDELKDLIETSLTEIIKNNTLNRPKEKELLTREETCELLKVDPSTLWRWTAKGVITAYAIGSRRFYKKEELLESLIQLKSKG